MLRATWAVEALRAGGADPDLAPNPEQAVRMMGDPEIAARSGIEWRESNAGNRVTRMECRESSDPLRAVAWGGLLVGLLWSGGCVRTHFDPGGGAAKGARPIAAADSALGRAVWEGDAAAVERLARDSGANACAPDGSSPLGLAALRGSPSVIEVLLAAGADLDLPCNDAVTAIQAVMDPLVEVRFESLESEENAGATTIETTALPDLGREYGSDADVRDRLRALTILFESGAAPNCPALEASDECDLPPLLTAIMTGDRRFVEVLLERGAEPGSLGRYQRMGLRLSGNGALLDFALEYRPGRGDP